MGATRGKNREVQLNVEMSRERLAKGNGVVVEVPYAPPVVAMKPCPNCDGQVEARRAVCKECWDKMVPRVRADVRMHGYAAAVRMEGQRIYDSLSPERLAEILGTAELKGGQ
jgi:hypothetical protein